MDVQRIGSTVTDQQILHLGSVGSAVRHPRYVLKFWFLQKVRRFSVRLVGNFGIGGSPHNEGLHKCEPSRRGQICFGPATLAFFSSSSTGTQVFLVESVRAPLFAALVFRGTEQELRDFQSDLAAVTIALESDSIRVHDGFLTALNSVWDDQVAPQLQGISVPIFYAGHSLGAALATLAALRHPPTAVYTFGSPLVGNDAFVASLKGTRIHRIVDGADLVTMVPPETLGYRHAGEPHHLRDSLVSGFKFDPLAWFRPPKSLADHAPINYVERIDSAT